MEETNPPNPSESASTPTGGLAGKLWKDRSTKGKVGVVLGALLVVSVVASALGDSDTESDAAPTTTAAPTTIAGETTTTVAETTTTAEATTTTTAELSSESLRQLFAGAFEGTRRDFIGAAEDLFVVESVDFFEYDATTDVLTLDVTPAFDFDSGVRDDAWELTRAFSAIWENFSEYQDIWPGPTWRVIVSTATYECAPEAMTALVDSRLSREQWETQCRVR